MKRGDKTARVLELHAQGLWNAEIAKRVPCSTVLVHNVLDERGLKRNRKATRQDPGLARLQSLATNARAIAGEFVADGDPCRREVALCLADAACELERAHALLAANEDELHD